jgi:hypothetical protein
VGAFWKALRRFLGQRFPYVWVPEWHPGGHGLHVHFAVGQFVPRAAIERAWGHGFISIKLLGDLPVGSGGLAESRLAARYLGKYLAKDFAGPAAGKVRPGLHRYEVAQGFQPSRLAILGQSEASVLAGASEIMHGPPAKSWHSQESEGWSGPPSLWAAWDR